MKSQLSEEFLSLFARLPDSVKDQARKILEQARDGASYKVELASFDLTEVRVKPDALVLVVDFRLIVK